MPGVLAIAAIALGTVQPVNLPASSLPAGPAFRNVRFQQASREVVVSIIVHGNQVVPDDEVLAIAGITVGSVLTEKILAEAEARLKASGKFESIEILKRYADIDDLTKIIVVINASEGAVRIADPLIGGGGPRVVRRNMWRSLMFMPILDAEDGYGVTFGARVAVPKPIGPRSRLSFPLTWGGMRRAGVELERSFPDGVLTRVEVGAAIQQRENPAYEVNDRRRRVWARGERAFGRLKAGATVGWQGVTFAGEGDSVRSIGADATFDTRLDPVLPRNAVFVTASIERLSFESQDPVRRTRVDARGFVGLFGQHVLVLRALREDASEPVPLYLRSLLGGWSNLRGFEAGFKTGDTLVAWSAEWRVPITSPLSVGKLGVSAFVDWGTAYDKGERYRDQTLHQGGGASVWLAITGFRMSVAVAHGKGAGTRFSFGGGLTF